MNVENERQRPETGNSAYFGLWSFVLYSLNRIHEGLLDAVEDDRPDEDHHQHEAKTIQQMAEIDRARP